VSHPWSPFVSLNNQFVPLVILPSISPERRRSWLSARTRALSSCPYPCSHLLRRHPQLTTPILCRYDLKTATRLYVLETHHSQVSAISFSPDGRRLVTAALDDRKLTVWKVGSSFGSMFVVGGPPRQGTGPGEPFKTYDFFVTEEDSES
jgi:WD40 repeat protein